jgi:uncharacterized protein YpuA (DUF1002 family)
MPKTVVEQLADAGLQIAKLEADAKAAADLLTEAQAKVAELTAKIESDAKAYAEAMDKIKVEAEQAAVTAKAAVDKLTADLSAVTTERDEAMKKLANPAYKMAGADGDKTAIEEGGAADGESDGMKQSKALAEYRKLDGKPDEQKAFRVKHWRVLGIDEEK